jgi:exosome complex component RRP41
MSDPYTDIQLIDKKGLRQDGRKMDELRPVKIEAGVLKRANGSCYLEWGENKVIAGVYGPREVHPRHMQNPLRGIVRARYNMAPFSVGDRKRPGPDRRSTEISKLLSEALERVVLTDRFPRTTVDVFIEVLEASAGTRCAGLTAASVALADAGIPMKDLVPSVASGKIDGHLVLDLGKAEDNFGEADVPFAMVPRTGEVVLLQMDGHLTQDEFDTILEMNRVASMEIYEIQKAALVTRYSSFTEEGEEEEKPAKEEPTKEEPAKEKPSKEEPAKEKPSKEKPAKEKPAKEEPAKEEPVKEEPPKEKPSKEEPAKEEPAKEEPAKEAPAKEKPAKEEATDVEKAIAEVEDIIDEAAAKAVTDEPEGGDK